MSAVNRNVVGRARSAVGAAAVVAAFLFPGAAATARPMAEVKAAKLLSVCANPNALPFAAERGALPGFQIEIARELAKRLGVGLKVEWIVPRYRASTVDCDMLMDTIIGPELEQRGLRATKPYHVSGVALVFARGAQTVPDFKSLREGMRVGVMTNSLASLVVSKTPAAMVPFGFEDDMIDAVAQGAVDAGAISPATAGYHNLRHPDQVLTIVRAHEREPDLRWNVAVGLRRADDALLEAVDAALKALLDDGTLATIYARYGIEHVRP